MNRLAWIYLAAAVGTTLIVSRPALPADNLSARQATLACKAGRGKVIAAIPDVCHVPPENPATPPGVPIPYPNTATSGDTRNGKIRIEEGSPRVEIKRPQYAAGSNDAASATRTQQQRTFRKTSFELMNFDVKLEGANCSRQLEQPPSAMGGTATTGESLSLEVSPRGQAWLSCNGVLLPTQLLPDREPAVTYVDAPPIEGLVFDVESSFQHEFSTDGSEEPTLEQIHAAEARIREYIRDNPEVGGFAYQLTKNRDDGSYGFSAFYGTGLVRERYVVNFDAEGTPLGRPAMTATGRVQSTVDAYQGEGGSVTREQRVDADGNRYVAKVVFSAGGGYYMFNENGQAYMAEIYDVETGERRGSLFEPQNFPALADHGEPLVKRSFVQLAVTRCPASCGAVTDVYNAVASEINLTVHKMNEHADAHAAANAPALEAEANYEQAMRSGSAADDRAGPDPGTPVARSLRQENRLRYEAHAELLQFLEGKLADVQRELEACQCPGELPGALQTTALWGDPYLAVQSPSQACLDTLVTLSGSGDLSGQEVVVTGARIARRRIDECSPLAVVAWAEFECAEGCGDVAISRSDAATVDCTGLQYPIGSELVGVPARQCDLSGLAAVKKETGSIRMSQSASDQALPQPVERTKPVEGGVPAAESARYADDAPTLVAVIDSGIDVQHPALLGHIWTNPGEIPGNGVDDDDNGLIDDINGWNFVSDNNDVRDTNGHGTLVAGLIAAQPGSANDVAGVDPGALVMALKVTNFAGRGNSVDVAAAITYAVNTGATIINLSLGGTEFSAAEKTAARYAIDRGALIIVAAGNQGADAAGFWPAALDGVITVAATTAEDTRADFSNWGQVVDIAAPGTDRISLRARYTDPVLFADENYEPGANIVGAAREHYRASGTSFAAPIVAGAASRLWASKPELTAAIVGRTLLQTARDLDIPGPDILTGYGLLDADAAMSADPHAFVEARISGVAVSQRGERRVVQVLGSADAADFERALLRLGSGREAADWQQHGEALTKPVRDGVLAEIDATLLSTAARWTLQLDVYDRSGRLRTAQFDLRLR